MLLTFMKKATNFILLLEVSVMNLGNEYNQNVLQLYKIALSEIQKHEAVYTSSLKEAIINPESVKLLKKIFAAIPKMYQIFIDFIEKQKKEDAIDQAKFMIKQLEDVRSKITSVKETIESHNNDILIADDDIASLLKLDSLAKEEIDNLKDYLIVFKN